jgi:AgrD protein
MGKRFTKLMVTFGATVLTFFALSTSASACIFGLYQPEEPKCLREE